MQDSSSVDVDRVPGIAGCPSTLLAVYGVLPVSQTLQKPSAYFIDVFYTVIAFALCILHHWGPIYQGSGQTA